MLFFFNIKMSNAILHSGPRKLTLAQYLCLFWPLSLRVSFCECAPSQIAMVFFFSTQMWFCPGENCMWTFMCQKALSFGIYTFCIAARLRCAHSWPWWKEKIFLLWHDAFGARFLLQSFAGTSTFPGVHSLCGLWSHHLACTERMVCSPDFSI